MITDTFMITNKLLMYTSTVAVRTHFCSTYYKFTEPAVAQLLSVHAIGAGGLGFKYRVGQIDTMSPTARHRCDVSSELCSSGAKPRRWTPPNVTRCGVIPRV